MYGAEHAAQILVWGLIDRPIRIATIPDTSWADLRTGYVLLTGRPPLHGFTDCATRPLESFVSPRGARHQQVDPVRRSGCCPAPVLPCRMIRARKRGSGLLDTQAADRPGDDELLDLLGALEDVVGLLMAFAWSGHPTDTGLLVRPLLLRPTHSAEF
jgi:hypothetical protein